jgi:predicted anti-sigma-YlaC factor YlaD
MSETKTVTCEEALRLLAEHLDGELDGAHQDAVEEHLARCRTCFSRAEFERRLKARLVTLRERAVETTFEHRIRALIGRFAVTPEE